MSLSSLLERVEDLRRPCAAPPRRSPRPSGTSMNSWMSSPLSAWAPPLSTFMNGTGRRRAPGPPRYCVERQAGVVGGRAGHRQRDGQDGVGAERGLVRRAVQLEQGLVDRGLLGGLHALDLGGDGLLDVLHGAAHALAAVALGVAVAQLHRLALAGGGARRHHGAAQGAGLELHLDLDGGVAAGIEDLARVDGPDRGQGAQAFRSRTKSASARSGLGGRARAARAASRASSISACARAPRGVEAVNGGIGRLLLAPGPCPRSCRAARWCPRRRGCRPRSGRRGRARRPPPTERLRAAAAAGAGQARAHAERGADERGRLVQVDVVEHLGADRLALRLDVDHLPAHHAVGAGGVGDLGHHVAEHARRPSPRPPLSATRRKASVSSAVAGQDGHGLAEHLVAGGAAAAVVVVVHRGQVVVDQRVGVDQLERAGGGHARRPSGRPPPPRPR